MYTFPLNIVDGDLKLDKSIEEIVTSEILSLLATRQGERPLRPNYGSPALVLQSLNLSTLLVDLNLALNSSLDWVSPLYVSVASTRAEAAQGKIKLLIVFDSKQIVEIPLIFT